MHRAPPPRYACSRRAPEVGGPIGKKRERNEAQSATAMSDPSGQRSRDRSHETARDPLEKKKDSKLESNQRLDVIPFLLRSTPFFHHEEFPGPSPTPLPAGRRRRARTDALRPRRPLTLDRYRLLKFDRQDSGH